jgi:hypothetical protein
MATALVPIDGPAPLAPVFSLVTAARAVPPDDAGERWNLGGAVWPYPCGVGAPYNPCEGTAGAPSVSTSALDDPVTVLPIAARIGFTCGTPGLDLAEFRRRAMAAFVASESAVVEKELLEANEVAANPALSKGTITRPNGNTAVSIRNGLAYLENVIAGTGRRGMIHATPGLVAASPDLSISKDGSNLQTKVGTIVVPGDGYVGTAAVPAGGGDAVTGVQEWVYATGLIEYRRGDVITVPALNEILTGVKRDTNDFTVWVEREYLVTMDVCVHAAVKVDRTL